MKRSIAKKRRLFTIVELVFILIIIGIVLSFVFRSIDQPTPTIKLEAAAKKLGIDLQYAKNLALSTSLWVGVVFEADPANVYRFYKANKKFNQPVKNPGEPGRDCVVNLYDFYKGVVISEGIGQVWFDPLGIPYKKLHGQMLGQPGLVKLGYQGVEKTVSISPNTGRIDIL